MNNNIAGPPMPRRRVFDCCIFSGEMDVLCIRLHELDAIVDCFVIVESTLTFSGKPREIAFNPRHPDLAGYVARIRHVVVDDMPDTADPWTREVWQRNAVLRGAPDAHSLDLLVLSDVDEVPSRIAVTKMAQDTVSEVFAFKMVLSCFYVNYRNVKGPEAASTWTVAATRRRLDEITPGALRRAVHDGREKARIFEQGGWHFSYLMEEAGIRRKIAAFSEQEFNNDAFLTQIDTTRMTHKGQELFNRAGVVWKLVPDRDLPVWLRRNRGRLEHLFRPVGMADRIRTRLGIWTTPARPARAPAPPVIVCPYLYDHEAAEVRSKFGLDPSHSPNVELFLWQDTRRIGPERAFEHCWDQFPDRDVIIIHSDMAPMPGEAPLQWYESLCGYRDSLPRAGIIACNLLYPAAQTGDPVRVQCAGGTFADGSFDYLRGPLLDTPHSGEGVWHDLLAQVRPVDWVTFGGVLIRREVIAACGPFDRRYQWAYVMDIDYSFEARLRGFCLVHVPVCLQHEESRTTWPLMEKNPELRNHMSQNLDRFNAKWRQFGPVLPPVARTGPQAAPPSPLGGTRGK
jgi:hypothetical protein